MGSNRGGGLALASGCAVLGPRAPDQAISMDDLPPAVKPLAEKEVVGCTIKEVEKEMKRGKVIYAISYFDPSGTLMEIEYAEDGVLISKGEE